MTEPVPQKRVYRFGVFEADPQTGELRKAGVRLHVQEQPFQVLLMLLERPGELVAREEVRQKLWSDTFVDFDHSLNTVINKLREALGDSANSPRFIETLARRGYRFIAPVEVAMPPMWATAAPAPSTAEAPQPTVQLPPFADEKAPPASTVATDKGASRGGVLTRAEEVPAAPRGIVLSLFALIQVMYLCFYLVSLGKLTSVERLVREGVARPQWVLVLLIVTAVVGIPTRLYLLAAVAFGYQGLGRKFQKLFAFIFPLDELWALAPFLVVHKIGFGLALAATAALLYLPFSQRTLMLMAYRRT
jgi:DNA-binding winged helix-turn-helix (wHTH) protein